MDQERSYDIRNIQFTGDAKSISGELSGLVTMYSDLQYVRQRKSILEKMEYGITQLRQAGDQAGADYFEKKRTGLKKNSIRNTILIVVGVIVVAVAMIIVGNTFGL